MTESCLYISPIGILQITETDGKITGLYPQRNEDGCICGVNTEPKEQEQHGCEHHSELLKETCRQLDEYFQGKRKCFHLPIDYKGTPFQESVWRELQNIPYGETRSYEDIAAKVGNPKAVRAVGHANNRNQILLVVPCHRVIHKNGDISGFACGVETKKYLLELERLYFLK